jgi:FtsP/CotA-like multicopper oxidase with cupredoxin domain
MVLALLLSVLGATGGFAAPLPGGTLNPLSIPKYVTPLVIPPVLFDDQLTDPAFNPATKEVALRQFDQQVLPTTGCLAAQALNPDLACNDDAFPKTTLWGYGDPNRPGTFNNPAFTFEVTKGTPTTVKWINGLVDANGKFLKHIIQDANGKPVIDQTLHWANPRQQCADGPRRPDCRGSNAAVYNGPAPMVTHVHGAHVNPESDGHPEAWWLPAANNIPASYATAGTRFADAVDPTNTGDRGYATFTYRNDQPTTTLWYHDHALGITRLNVYAASAGFWLIRTGTDGETGLVSGTLPGPAPKAGDNPNCNDPQVPTCVRDTIREIPIAIQGKAFNVDGSQFYPANRAFFEGIGEGQNYDRNASLGLRIPFFPAAGTSDISPIWNPEAFFNTLTVNGNTWPVLEVAQALYRFRLLNANDSSFLNLSLREVVDNGDDGVAGTADDTLGLEIPFYQIGAEQSLLPNVVKVERGQKTTLDIIVFNRSQPGSVDRT